MAVLAVCSFQDTPARWVAIHRRHHEHADDEPDPHTPGAQLPVGACRLAAGQAAATWRAYGVFARYAKDVLRDPFYRRLENGALLFRHHLSAVGAVLRRRFLRHRCSPAARPARRRSSASACWSGACSCARCSTCTTPGRSIRSPICGATATTRPTRTAATTHRRLSRDRRGLAQQPPRRSALGPPRPQLVGARHHLPDDPPVRPARPCRQDRRAQPAPPGRQGPARHARQQGRPSLIFALTGAEASRQFRLPPAAPDQADVSASRRATSP